MKKPDRIVLRQLEAYLRHLRPFKGSSWQGAWNEDSGEFEVSVYAWCPKAQTYCWRTVARAVSSQNPLVAPQHTFYIEGKWHRYAGDGHELTHTIVKIRNVAQRVWN